MSFEYFLHNGQLQPVARAVVPLANIEYSYGFGVYETIRVSNGTIYFLDEHCQRLLESAKVIELAHELTTEQVAQYVQELVHKNNVESCNVKILLIGGSAPNLYIQCLNPRFPDRKFYQTGVHCLVESMERQYPHAKTLNMLPSYLAYRHAQQHGAYDTLLVNRHGHVTEGTRTNFFAIKDRTIVSPPPADILLGVMRSHVIEVARANGFQVNEQPIPLNELSHFDSLFLTSASSKIMPIRSVDNYTWEISAELKELMASFNSFLANYS
jgi:branched-subunit amino acid aminotransferase/4-amino-4-deoxychorismate lyase